MMRKLRCDAAAGLLDLLTGRGADFGALDGEFASQPACAEDLDLIAIAGNQADSAEGGFIDGGTVFEGVVEFANVHDFNRVLESPIVETFFRETAMHRHLSTFKAGTDTAARTGHLPFVTFTGCFAMAGAFSAADALAALAGTGAVLCVLELHVVLKIK
jgi:hypothetical protein